MMYHDERFNAPKQAAPTWILLGGASHGQLQTIEAAASAELSWPQPRHSATVWVEKSTVWVFGGQLSDRVQEFGAVVSEMAPMFASDLFGIVPDLITTAKGIAGGLPLAAVTGRAEIMDASHTGGLGGTYGGNPVACAAALAAIEVYETEDLSARARHIGDVLERRLRDIQASDPRLGDIRGRGAMIAVEFVDPATGEPDAALTSRVVRAALDQGVLMLTCGTYGNVIRFLPPLVIGDDLLDDALDVLAHVLSSS